MISEHDRTAQAVLAKGDTATVNPDLQLGLQTFWRPPYEVRTQRIDEGWRQEINFGQVPIRVEFQEHSKQGELREIINISGRKVTISYLRDGQGEYYHLQEVFLEEGRTLNFDTLDPLVETTFSLDEDRSVSLFSTHPDMNPDLMFGGSASFEGNFALDTPQDRPWIIHFDHEQIGFSLPRVLSVHQANYHAENNQEVLDSQIFVVPNNDYISAEEAGFKASAVPIIMSSHFSESQEANPRDIPHVMIAVQRFGHAKIGAGILHLATQDGFTSDDIVGFFVPTLDAIKRTGQYLEDGMPSDMVQGWCYTPEKGYGGERLPLDPTDSQASKTMLAFLSLNRPMVDRIVYNASRGVVIYSDAKQDAVILNMLGKMTGINTKVITKTYRIFDNPRRFAPEGDGSEYHRIMQRALAARADASYLIQGLGFPPETPDGLEFMYEKVMAAFGEGSFTLYTTDGGNADVPLRLGFRNVEGEIVGGTEIVPIPLAFNGAESRVSLSRGEARQRLALKLDNINPVNLDRTLIDKLAKDPELPVVSLQLGSSDNLFVGEAMAIMIRAAQDPRLRDTLFLMTGYRGREEYLEKAMEVMGIQLENNLPPNVAIMGMRRDIDTIQTALDVVVTTASIGNMSDAVRNKTALLMLGPDTILKAESEKLQQLNHGRTPTQLRDTLAVGAETGWERAFDCTMIGHHYETVGIPPNIAMLDLTQNISSREAVEAILYALENKETMINALKNIPTVPVDYLYAILMQVRGGAGPDDIRRFVRKSLPDFEPRTIEPQEARPPTLSL